MFLTVTLSALVSDWNLIFTIFPHHDHVSKGAVSQNQSLLSFELIMGYICSLTVKLSGFVSHRNLILTTFLHHRLSKGAVSQKRSLLSFKLKRGYICSLIVK